MNRRLNMFKFVISRQLPLALIALLGILPAAGADHPAQKTMQPVLTLADAKHVLRA